MNSRLTHLKIKLRSLEAESRIIRHEEHKVLERERHNQGESFTGYSYEHVSLREHRKHTVGSEARHSHLAYGFLKGIPYHVMERTCKDNNKPDLDKVKSIAERFWHKPIRREWKVPHLVANCQEFDKQWNTWIADIKQ